MAAAGDIACNVSSPYFSGGKGTAGLCHQSQTSAILLDLRRRGDLQAVLPLGDLQYECGSLADFEKSFHPSWGRVKDLMRPVVGNHEYQTHDGTGCDTSGKASGYYRYFGGAAGDPAKGYYSFDLGAWHLIALNSNCNEVGGCQAGSTQERWLRDDLARHRNRCVLAYWHHPRFNSGRAGNDDSVRPLWQALWEANADVVLSGHAHIYERFGVQDAAGNSDRQRGIRQFTVGTGGKNLGPFTQVRPNSEVRSNAAFGVLTLTLHSTSYNWRFIPEAGATFTDAGSNGCH